MCSWLPNLFRQGQRQSIDTLHVGAAVSYLCQSGCLSVCLSVCLSILQSGLIAGGATQGRDRQTVFFTAADPMDQNWVEQEEIDLTKPRHAAYQQKWRISQDAVFWVEIGRAQRMELRFFKTRANAIIIHNTHPSMCIERVVSRKTEEILYTRTKSPRLAPTLTLKSNWRQEEDSEEAATSYRQLRQPSRLVSTETPVVFKSRAELDQQHIEDVQKDNEEIDQESMGRPVLDFRIHGLLFVLFFTYGNNEVRD